MHNNTTMHVNTQLTGEKQVINVKKYVIMKNVYQARVI